MDNILIELRDRAILVTNPDFVGDKTFVAAEVLYIFAEIDRLAIVHREEQGRSADRLKEALTEREGMKQAYMEQRGMREEADMLFLNYGF